MMFDMVIHLFGLVKQAVLHGDMGKLFTLNTPFFVIVDEQHTQRQDLGRIKQSCL